MEAQGTKYCNGGPSCIQRIHAISTSPLESIMYRNIAPLCICKYSNNININMTLKLQAKQTKITVAIHVLIFFSNFCSMQVRLIVNFHCERYSDHFLKDF